MNSPRRLAYALLMLLVATYSASAEKVASMPAPTGYIDDYASVLSSPAKADMEATARELLEEVVSKADGTLRSRAQTMLDALG